MVVRGWSPEDHGKPEEPTSRPSDRRKLGRIRADEPQNEESVALPSRPDDVVVSRTAGGSTEPGATSYPTLPTTPPCTQTKLNSHGSNLSAPEVANQNRKCGGEVYSGKLHTERVEGGMRELDCNVPQTTQQCAVGPQPLQESAAKATLVCRRARSTRGAHMWCERRTICEQNENGRRLSPTCSLSC